MGVGMLTEHTRTLNRARRWCPKGCGKSVTFNPMREVNRKEWFLCDRCNQNFSRKQLL